MAGAAPKEWRLIAAHAVHLGSGKFCDASTTRPRFSEEAMVCCSCCDVREKFVVFAGVEVVSCGGDGGELRIIKHRSERYMLHARRPGLPPHPLTAEIDVDVSSD
ncbi:hypothetical protein SEVIR_1G375750v4 [Setaria viridis]